MERPVDVPVAINMATPSSEYTCLRSECSRLLLAKPDIFSQGVLFGFSIGMNLTVSLFLGEPPPVGFGRSLDTIAAVYATPVVSSPASVLEITVY